MSRVGSVRGTSGRAAAPRTTAGASGFALSGGPERGGATAIAGTTSVAGAALSVLQEDAAALASRRDAQARQRADAMLDDLGALQRHLLDGAGLPREPLERLAKLRTGEDGADPALREMVRAVALRAAVELAKRGI